MLTPVDVERCWRIRNNPYRRNGMTLEAAILYCDEIESHMRRLTTRERAIVQCFAAGYKAREMPAICGISLRTIMRTIAAMRWRNDVFLPVWRRGRAA